MKNFASILYFITAATLLSACGGGGGGGSTSVPGTSVSTPAPPPPSVTGDMMYLAQGRGWNYQATNMPGVGNVTASLYVNQDLVNANTFVLVGSAVNGLQPTVLVDHATPESNLLGGLGISTTTTNGYVVTSEVSAGSISTVPNIIFVPNTLTQGQVLTPAPGGTVTVLSVGVQPNSAACAPPVTASTVGAQVRYAYANLALTMSFVPGCGITQIVGNTGAVFNLISVGNYGTVVGDLSIGRRVESISPIDTVRSLLGLNRNPQFKGAYLFP